MYINHYEFIHHTSEQRASVNLSIEDCASSDLDLIQRLANNERAIKIYDRETVQFTLNSTHGFRKSKIELTPVPKSNDIYIKVKKVIYHNPATIVFWSDGTKTVVKCGKNDIYDPEKGFYIACTKKLFGNDYKAVGKMNKALTMAETKGAGNGK